MIGNAQRKVILASFDQESQKKSNAMRRASPPILSKAWEWISEGDCGSEPGGWALYQ